MSKRVAAEYLLSQGKRPRYLTGPTADRIRLQGNRRRQFRRRRVLAVAIAPEVKFHDVAFVTDATSTGTIVDLNAIVTGDTNANRDGVKVMNRSLDLRIAMALESIAQNAIVRFLLIWDTNANATAPTFAQVLDAITVQSLRNNDFTSRFWCLWDECFVINSTSGTAASFQKEFIHKHIKLPPKCQLTTFQDSGTSVPITGSLTLMYLSDVAAGVVDVDILGAARLRFVG